MTESDDETTGVDTYWDDEAECRRRVWREDFQGNGALYWYTLAWTISAGPKPVELVDDIDVFRHRLEPLAGEFHAHDDWFAEHIEVAARFICQGGLERAITYRRVERFSGGIPDTEEWLEYSLE